MRSFAVRPARGCCCAMPSTPPLERPSCLRPRSRARCSTSSSPSAACPTRMRWTAILRLLSEMIDSNYSGPVALLQGLAGSVRSPTRRTHRHRRLRGRRPRSPQELSLRLRQGRAGAIRRRLARPPSPGGCHGHAGQARLRRHGDDLGRSWHVSGGHSRVLRAGNVAGGGPWRCRPCTCRSSGATSCSSFSTSRPR